MKKYILIGAAVALFGGGYYGYYLYNKPLEKVNKSTAADIQITATELLAAFEADENAANSKYLDKLVQVKGTLQSSTPDEHGHVNLSLDAGSAMSAVVVELNTDESKLAGSLQVGAEVTVKGFCQGYLTDVVITRAAIVQ